MLHLPTLHFVKELSTNWHPENQWEVTLGRPGHPVEIERVYCISDRINFFIGFT